MSTVHELEQRIKVLESLLGRGVDHLSVDSNGYLKIDTDVFSSGYKVWNEGNLPTPIPIDKGGTGQTTAANAFEALSGLTLDKDTNNTADTWVPVFRNEKIQHRVIPPMLGTRYQPTVQLANTAVITVNSANVVCYQLNATEYLCVYTVRLRTTQSRTNLAACRFKLNDKVLRPIDAYNFSASINGAAGRGWWNGDWFAFSGTWNANADGELYGAFVGYLV